MRNQPKYNFFKNTSYALKGLVDLIKTLTNKALMFITLMGMLIAETTNSAIERVVDLVTLEHHDMAGRAKDVGSAIVFLSIFIFIVTWTILLIDIL